MIASLAKRGQTVFVALTVLVALGGAMLVAGVLFLGQAGYSHYQLVGQEETRFETYRMVANGRDQLRSDYEVLSARTASEVQFAATASVSDASGQMERNLRTAATGAGALIRRLEPLSTGNDVIGERFGYGLTLEGDIKSIDLLLENLGLAFPYYYFEDIVLEPVTTGQGQELGEHKDDRLRFEANVFSYRRPAAE